MSTECKSLRVLVGQARKDLVSAQYRALAAGEVVFFARATYDLEFQCDAAREQELSLAPTAQFKLAAKAPDDLDGDVLFQSTNVTSTAEQLAAGLVCFGAVSLNTVELVAWLGTDESRRVRLELVELDGDGAEERVLLHTDVLVQHDVLQGDEDDPVYAAQVKHQVAGTAAPTGNDDADAGYAPGSVWVYGSRIWLCHTATAGAAIWKEVNGTLTEELAGHIETASNKGYVLSQSAAVAGNVVSLAIKAGAGTATAKVTIDDVDVTGLTGLSVSTSETVATASGANGLAVGQTIKLVLSNVSDATDVAFSLQLARA